MHRRGVSGSFNLRRRGGALLVSVILVAFAGCHAGCHPRSAAIAPSADDERIAKLRVFETGAREKIDYARLPSSESSMGADPWAIEKVKDGYVGILRGRSLVVFFDASMEERARLPAPRSPMGLAVSPEGDVYVAGSLDATIARYAVREGKPERTGTLTLQGPVELRELAWSPPATLTALDSCGSRAISLALGATDAKGKLAYQRTDQPTCRGPVGLLRTEHHRLENCLFDHVIQVDGAVAAKNDGPFWGMAAKELDDKSVLIAAGGVEDHKLDRSEGFFGYVDSFVYLYKNGARIAAINVSDYGVLTPKALSIDGDDITVTGYGSDKAAVIHVAGGHETVTVRPLVPGVRSMTRAAGGFVMASPLLDAWVVDRPGSEPRVIPVRDDKDSRSFDTRLGEALIFTSLMAPWNKSEGKLSRFTCETCHFEGYGDGRVHFTGRQDIHASTKPLFGLVGNKPHFSRALDPDLAAVAMNEFRVANAKSDHDPWFAIERRDHPWMAHLGMGAAERVAPEELRRAFMTFLMDFSHRPHPALAGRTAFSDEERRGAEIFRDRCEGCHAARLAADDPGSRLPFEQWERSIFADSAAIVWATSSYAKTGVVPYVNERGTRVPSLRRLYAKRPYFTNGTARELDDVLKRARLANGVLVDHGGADGAGTALDAPSQHALGAFLGLL